MDSSVRYSMFEVSMTKEEKYKKVMTWIGDRNQSLNLSGLASIANVPKFSLIKAVKHGIPLKNDHVDKLYDCIELTFKIKL